MTVRAQEQKNAHIEALVALCATSSGGAQDRAFGRFVRQFYAHVPPEDVLARSREDLLGAALSLWRFAAERRPGEAKVRVVNPEAWRSAGRTVVEIANDDMPFLVDSVTAALNGAGCVVNLVIHPVVLVARGAEFRLKDVLEPDEGNGGAALRESFMHVEIGEERDPEKLAALARRVEGALLDVRRAVTDWQPMRSALARVLDDLASRPPPLPQKELTEGLAFLRWLDEDNFTFLGYREYRFDGGAVSGDGAGLGILRDENYSVFDGLRRFAELPPEVQDFLRQPKLLMIAKSNKRATVHRAAHMDAIGVKIFAADGRVTGERLFLGLFTSLAYSRSARAIPLLRQKVQKVIARAGFPPTSHDGKALLHILDNFPRDELFQLGEDELFDVVTGILNLQERQRIALFVRRDPFERFVSCFVFVPRERYNTELRVRMARILEEAYAGEIAGFQTQLDESVLARIHFIVRTTRGRVPDIDAAEVERRLVEAGRTWADRLSEALAAAKGAETGRALLTRYAAAFPTAYRETRDADAAIEDIDLVEHVLGGAPLGLRLHRPEGAGERGLAFTLIREGSPIALSDVLPMLENMGLRVISETPHEVAIAGRPVFLHDFTLETRAASAADAASARARFEEAFAKVWSGELESDGFNRLVLLAGLSWRQVVVLRTYCKVLRQAGAAFSQAYMEDALAAHGPIAAALVRLFETRFDPAFKGERELKANGIVQEIDHALDAVTNLDEDRILRSYLQLIQKTLRTNHYQTDAQGGPKPYLSVKLASSEIDLLPLPRPLFEVYVYSPRTEGVHLRGGKVARGGIRWSDRKEDFRTEILGLMKAQMVKNAVIVPVGSKGGFVVKHPPAGREAYQAEGVECYKTLMRGLLDVTDNIVGEQIVPPVDVVRRDPDDPYLVVAADKGTATFSDIANGVARDYGFWLDDAFASGGSAGYDHKTMGITARGAWETVKRHFRELGTDIQTTPFTCVGVGDMSGDVFGNGMLLSPATKLVGAFNHLHIFVDPEPDPAASLAERKRLFEKPRSAWSDYDVKLISKGGGIFERSAKSIALSPEMKTLFGIEAERVTPAELIRAMLKAQVDLLWFGGIGTYVKAAAESQADAGDRANDVLRIDGRDIRARVVGEGANLGVTQRGRIEYALAGGRINTDAIDNSAGVDTSDHEVNLKILLNPVLGREEKRNQLLAEMTDDVAELVLRDNYLQSLAISLAELHGAELLDRHARLIRTLEREGKLDRALEFLPDDETLAARAHARHGLTRPELAVLLAYAKNVLYAELLPSDLPDDPQLVGDLVRYFPKRLSKPYREAMLAHRLRREIIATFVTNSIVNRAGIAFVGELKERTGRPASDIARAYAVTRDAFELRPLWSQVDALDNKVATAIQYDMVWAAQLLAERATLWLLGSGLALDVQARLNQFRPGIAKLRDVLTQILPEDDRAALEKRIAVLTDAGVPGALAERVAKLDWLVPAFDIVRLDETSPLDIVEVGRIYFAVGARFGFDRLRALAQRLDATTAWQKMAVAALLDDLFALQSVLAGQALAAGGVAKWEQQHRAALAPLEGVLAEMLAATTPDLAMLTVTSRQLRSLAGQN